MTRVMIRFDVVGFHCWPDAKGPVEYLSAQHRHLFKFHLEVQVTHENRAIEFHTLKRATLATMHDHFHSERGEFQFGARSCEHIARELGNELCAQFGYEVRVVEVWEDGECGARVEWPL